MSNHAKLGVCIAVAAFGAWLILQRSSLEAIIIGFACFGIAGPLAYYYWARVQQPNKEEIAIEALLEVQKQHEQAKKEKSDPKN